MKGLILAGGLGTRLRPLTHTGAKQLIPVANKPVVQYGIEGMVEAGIKEIGIIVGYTPERVKSVTEALGDGARFGCKITYIEQDAPRGLAHAVGIARPFLGAEPFVVYLGDNILKNGIAKHVADFRAQGPACGLLLAKVANPTMYGVAELSREGRVTGVEEKPTKPKTDLAIVGVYYFSREV
ncbi:MAG TPA: sugar phosphate nucleotidyltransferase, partial [Burkholderiales bacterium]|nr:sugar phosphate nucleotidyltransferase [Burkholderiales bacterium]